MSLFRTKSVEQSLQDTESEGFQLKRQLTALDLTVFGIGVIIGAGIFTVTGRAAQSMAGPAIVLSFVVGAVACGLAALCYAELASLVPVSGSAYTFSYATLGEMLAWIVGWDLLLELVLASSVVAQGWSQYFAVFIGNWNIHLPENLQSGGVFDVMSFVLITGLTLLIALGIKESLRVNLVLVALKLFVILFVIFAGIGYVNTDNYTPFIPDAVEKPAAEFWHQPLLEAAFGMTPQAYGVMGIIAGAALVFFAYIGFDVVATTAEEARNPKRDLPIGIIASLSIATVLYVAVALVITGMVRYDQIDPKAALASAFADLDKPGFATLISAGAVAGLTTVVMTLMIGATRVMFAMSRDGLLPSQIAHTNPRTGTPVRLTVGIGVFVALVASLTPIGKLEEMVNIGTLSAFFLVALAVPVLRRKRPDLKRAFKVPLSPVLPILSAAITLYLMLSLPVDTWVRFLIWLLIGFIWYFTYGRRNSRVGKQEEALAAESVASTSSGD